LGTVYRASLFALAKAIDWTAGEVVLSDWTKPARTRDCRISLLENAVLNLFLTPRTIASAAAEAGLAEKIVAHHGETLRRNGLLLSEDEWQQARIRQPYVNLRSVWTETRNAAKTFASYEDAYANDAAPWNELPVATDLLSLAPLPGQAKLRLLDVGCGTGHNLALIEQLGFSCFGIDISETAIARLRMNTERPDAFVAGSVTDLPWPDASFDLIVDIGCLHCLQAKEIAPYVREIRRVLAPGGRFLCRSFKPRDEDLLMAQPVKMDRLGYAPDEVVACFSNMLPVQLVKEGPIHGFYFGRAPTNDRL